MHTIHSIVPVAVVLSLMSAPGALQASSSPRPLLPIPLHGLSGEDPADAVKQRLALESSPPAPNALHYAVQSGDVERVKEFAHESYINRMHGRGKTPMHEAVEDGHTEIVKILIDAGADLNIQSTYHGLTPLHMASIDGLIDIAKALLDAGAYVDPVSYDYNTPLHHAIYHGHTELVRLLLREGASLYARKRDDVTPLHIAAGRGWVEVTKILLRQADFDYSFRNGYSWPSYIISPPSPPEEDWIKWHYRSSTFVNGFTNLKDHHGHGALYRSVHSGHAEIAKLLIEAGAHLNAQDKVGNTPLHGAALQGQVEAAQVLIGSGADVNAKNNEGETPLDLAHQQQHSRLTEVLVAAGGQRGG